MRIGAKIEYDGDNYVILSIDKNEIGDKTLVALTLNKEAVND